MKESEVSNEKRSGPRIASRSEGRTIGAYITVVEDDDDDSILPTKEHTHRSHASPPIRPTVQL